MGIANIINNSTTTSGGEIVRELVNSSDGQGLHFDGAVGSIDIASPPDLGTKFSFEFVLKADTWESGQSFYLLDFGNGGRLLLYADSSTSNNLALYDTGNRNFGVAILDDLKVHHLVVTVDGTSAVLYDNGNQVGTTTLGATPTVDACSDAAIGSRFNGASGHVAATIFRTRFYNRTLSSAEVQTAYERADVDYADQYGSQTSKILNGTSWTGASGSTKPNDWSLGLDGTFTIDSSSGSGAEPALKMQRNGSTNYPYIFQTFTAEIGKKYRVKYRVKNIDVGSGGNLRVGIGSTAVGTQYNVSDYTATSWTAFEEVYTATTTTFSVYLQVNTTTGTEGGYFDSVTVEQVGCVSDYQTQWANPTQSLTVQDASGNADGTCSASGVTQVQPVVQLNSTSARIGTTAATPADGQLIIGAGGSGGTASAHADELLIDNNGNSGITIASGASDYGGINFSDSGNNSAGIVRYDHSDNSLKLYTQTTERLTIDSSGKTTATATTTDSSGLVDTLQIKNGGTSAGDGGKLLFTAGTSTNGAGIGSTGQALNSADLKFYTGGSNERLHIHHSTGLATFNGGIAQGGTSGSDEANIDTSGVLRIRRDSGVGRDNITFTNGGSAVGSITSNTSATQYNTSSDYRLKENLTPLTGALDRLDALPVYRFNFKADPDTTVDGFVAHEVSAHVPEAVTGEKDAMRTVVVQEAVEAVEAQPATYWEEGDELPEGVAVGDEKTAAVEAVEAVEEVTEEQIDPQGIDQSKLVPLLVAAVKELKAKVETLENA